MPSNVVFVIALLLADVFLRQQDWDLLEELRTYANRQGQGAARQELVICIIVTYTS